LRVIRVVRVFTTGTVVAVVPTESESLVVPRSAVDLMLGKMIQKFREEFMMRRLFLLVAVALVATPWASSNGQQYQATPPLSRASDAAPLFRLPAVDSLQPFQPHQAVPIGLAEEILLGLSDDSRSQPIQLASWGPEQSLSADKCSDGCKSECCCPPPWAHRSGVFGEFLFLRPRDAEVAYAVPIDSGIGPPPVQIGPVAVTDPDNSSGFRAGLSYCLDEYSSVALTYTMFQSSTMDEVNLAGGGPVLRSLVLHPSLPNANSNFLNANAQLDIDFDFIDADYRAVWWSSDRAVVNYLLGLRYTRMDQDFNATFSGAGTTDSMVTDVNFDGAGIRLGLDAERHHACNGLLVYGKASSSFIAGDSRAHYLYGTDMDPVVVDTRWKAGRIISQLELELGVGWQSECGRFRATAGYLMSSWFNTLTTDKWVQAVQTNNYGDLNDTMTFDGLTFRGEYRF